MTVDVTMPQLGETVAEGTVTRWLRRVGEPVRDQEPLVEVATDKVDTEIPSPVSGTLIEIRVPENVTVAVGTVIAVIGDGAGPTSPRTSPGAVPQLASVAVTSAAPVVGRVPRHRHSPLVRRLAREAGVDLHGVPGTGPGGRVTRADVGGAAARHRASMPTAPVVTPAAPSAGERREPMRPARTAGAERMTPAAGTAVPSTCVVEVDLSGVLRLRRGQASVDAEGAPSLIAFVVDAVVQGLRAHPPLHASVDADGRTVVHHSRQHIGIAVDTRRGPVVPVIADAGDLSLRGLARRIEDLADRARSGSLASGDLSAATFTVTDTASRGVLFDTPVLLPGQVGCLGMGAVVERPVVLRRPGGERAIAIREMAYLALTYDHRLVDPAVAATFLAFVKQRLEAGYADGDGG